MREPKELRKTVFGNPILREKATELTPDEIVSDEIQQFIADLKYTVDKKKLGVGIAAPQVGRGIALALLAIKPTPNRPNRTVFDRVIINPKIVLGIGEKALMWEGCISFASGTNNVPFAQTERWKKIEVEYLDEQAQLHHETLTGLAAHVFQHEADHLNGTLFVDRVVDPSTFMLASEFRKRILPTLPPEE
ncbi:MAG: peptide deformylase [Candidatus Saccharimonadales bacterium]